MSDEFQPLTELRTPLEITNRMQWVLHFLAKSTGVIKEHREAYVDARDAFNKASYTYQVSIAGQGNAAEREQRAQLEHWDLFIAMRAAEKILQHTKDKRADLDTELSALQSELKAVIAEMQLSGKFGA